MSSETRIIALAVDGSEYAEYAFDWYYKFLHRHGQEMIVFYVPEDCDFHAIRYVKFLHHPHNTLCLLHGVDETCVEKVQKEIAKGGQMKESIERQYSKITELEEKYKLKMQKHKINGNVLSIPSKNAGQAIIEAASEEGAFAIVMGTRGRNKLKKVLLGSVSDYVVKNASIPVIVVRSNTDHAAVK